MTWASDNAAVATVSATGVVTAVAAGTATVTATSEGQSDAATVAATITGLDSPRGAGVDPGVAIWEPTRRGSILND